MSSLVYSWPPFALRGFLRYLSIAVVVSAGLLGCAQETTDATTSKDTKAEAVIGASVCIPPEGNRSSSEAIEIPVADYIFKVPCNYLVEWHDDFIFIWPEWPGMGPFNTPKAENGGAPVDVKIDLWSKNHREQYEVISDRNFRIKREYFGPIKGSVAGLEKYYISKPHETWHAGYYVADSNTVKTPSGFPLVFSCSRCDPDRTRCTCRTSYQYPQGIWLVYRFDKKILNDWKEIDRKVRDLVNELIEER